MKPSKLKEVYIVQYADDFKLLCRSKDVAERMFIALKQWLPERLQLEISPEKSKIVNVKGSYSDFLGFKIKVVPKGKEYVTTAHVGDKAQKQIIKRIKDKAEILCQKPTPEMAHR